MSGTRLDQWTGGLDDRSQHWHLVLTEQDAIRWDRERLEMIKDAMFLIRQALAGNVEGAANTSAYRTCRAGRTLES